MKKILIGGFVAESNQHVSKITDINGFSLKRGDEVLQSLYIDNLVKNSEIETVSTLYADGRGGGIITESAFNQIKSEILQDVRDNYQSIDGIFMFIHGASQVQNIGSGDHLLIKEIREIVGRYLPIVIVSDPHGNITNDFSKHTTVHRTFRHSPHTDRAETHHIAFNMLLNLLEKRENIHPEVEKIPVMLGGERSVSTDEPMVTINKFLDELEEDQRILSASLFIGYVRHDSDKCGATAVVVPSKEEYQLYAKYVAKKIYNFMIDHANLFSFHGEALELDESLKISFEKDHNEVYITDSGDNCTAGASGFDTEVLRTVLDNYRETEKKVLFACIADPQAIKKYLIDKKVNDEVSFDLGMNINDLSAPVSIEGTIISKGKLYHHYGDPQSIGIGYTVKLKDINIYVIVAEHAVSFAERKQYEGMNLEMDDFDLKIVKQGYLYPELKEKSKYYVMALTDGSTNQRTERLNYKLIMRPMYPYDKVEDLKRYSDEELTY